MKKKERKSGDGQAWLNTYADMITLVLTFFVLLYSISNVNITKLEQISQAMQKKLGIESDLELEEVSKDIKFPEINEEQSNTPSAQALSEIKTDLEGYMQSNNIEATVTQKDEVLYIRFKNEILFGPDSPTLLDSGIGMVDYMGDVLKVKESEITAIYINGHTADAPNSAWNDRILSSDRANNVAIYLEEQKGIDPKKLISRGYGKNYPIADNSTKEGREQNRRVDIIIIGKDADWKSIEGDGSGSAEIFYPSDPVSVPDAQ